MNRLLSFVSTCLLGMLAFGLQAQPAGRCQPEITIRNVDVKEHAGFIKLELLARGGDCRPMGELEVEDITITEQIAASEPVVVDIQRMDAARRYDTLDLREPIDVHFLVDLTDRAGLAASREMIGYFLDKYRRSNAEYFLHPFGSTVQARVSLDPAPEQVQSLLNQLRVVDEDPHLYGALISLFNSFYPSTNKQLVFVFSRGRNAVPDYGESPRLPPRREDVFQAVDALGDRLYAFTVTTSGQASLGADAGAVDTSLLAALPARTPQLYDGYAIGQLPEAVAQIFEENRRLIGTHTVEIGSSQPRFTGEQRTYTVYDKTNQDADSSTFALRLGSFTTPISLAPPRTGSAWLVPTLVGLLLVGGALAVFYFILPLLRRREFARRFVGPYVPRPGRTLLDPMTREPIPAGAPVVSVCAMVVPLRTWQDCGEQCPHYPGCTNNTLQCDGKGKGFSLNFFSLYGVNRRLNWVWFGMVGGFVGWLLYALLLGWGGSWINALEASSASYTGAETLVRDAALGACFGVGLTLLLAIMEERSSSRRISIRRILLRTLLGGLLATLAFGGGVVLLNGDLIQNPGLASGISWVFFGVGLGAVLCLHSSIEPRRGLLGGLLAGIVGFAVYILFGLGFTADLLPKVLSLLITGSLLGLVLDTVVKLAESYEMEYVVPANYRRKVPLSKWLKNGWDIMIGSQPGSQVYVKWPDEEVLPEHARIKLDGGRVYLFPQGETLINGSMINGQKRTQLEDGDLIQLGRGGGTQMRFLRN